MSGNLGLLINNTKHARPLSALVMKEHGNANAVDMDCRICPRVVPKPPIELLEFRRLSKDKRESEGQKFYAQEKIKKYLDLRWNIEQENKNNVLWLYEIFKTTNSSIIKEQVVKLFNTFRKVIKNYDQPYSSLLIDWSKYPIPDVYDETINDLNTRID